MKSLFFGVAFSVLAFAAQAQDSRYSTWSDPSKPQSYSASETTNMVKELRTLVDQAEKARAADPNFLQDLRDLAARYDGSYQRVLFSDDFIDGDFTNNPAWKLGSGKFWVERGYGLRSFVDQSASTTSSSQSSERQVSKEELIIGVLGAVLGAKTQQQQPTQQQATTSTAIDPAELYLPTKVSNAFTMKMTLSSWKDKSEFSFGPYQGTNRNTGYRLIYRAGQTPALQLVRYYANSSSVVDTVKALKLEDQKNHDIIWKRTAAGVMQVSVDGKLLMETSDRGFREDFAGFVLKNSAGDFIVKSISVAGS